MRKLIIALLFILFVFFLFPNNESFLLSHYQSKTIIVEVKGELENPGLFTLPAYSTISDLVGQLSLTDDSDLSSLNLSLTLKNNDVVVIGKKQEVELISINSATLEQLVTLPGIGIVKAQNIIIYRNNNGPFQTISDIKKVKGIGEKIYEKIKELICL